jgi:hypothetical protein
MLLVRDESELAGVPVGDDSVLWLGPGPVPEGLRLQAVELPPDPPLIEGWIALRQLGDQTIRNKSVKELLEYQGVSLWWLVHHWLVYGKGLASWDDRYRILHRLVACSVDKPQRLVLLTSRADDDLVASAFAATRGIQYTWATPIWVRSIARFKLRWNAAVLMKARTAKMLLRGFLGRAIRKNSLAGRLQSDLLFNTTSSTWNARAGTDRVLNPLIDAAVGRGLKVTGLHLDFRRSLGLDTLRQLDGRIVAWETLATPAMVLRSLRLGRRISRSLATTFPGTVLGVPAAGLLWDREVVLPARLADAILALDTSRRAFEALRPRCLYVVDPYDLWGCALVVAARNAGVPSVEVQHGLIAEHHSGYLHLDGEVASDRAQASPFSPVPDVIVVHGESAKESLVEQGHFAPDAIRVTGSPTIEAARERSRDRQGIRARLGIGDASVAALFFGTLRHIRPVDDQHLRAFLECCRGIPIIKPLLRPYPGDHEGPKRYRSIAMASGVSAPVLVSEDSLDLILAADIVVSYNSTTALDAMALGRAVIQINMSGAADQVPFVDDGAALGARTREDLCLALLALSDPGENASQVRRNLAYARHYYANCADPARAMLDAGFPGHPTN